MIFFFWGPDTYRSRKKLVEIKEKFLAEVDESGLNLTMIDGARADLTEFSKAVSTPPFLARKRLVVVENIISGAKKKEIKEGVVEILDKKDLLKDLLLVFWEGEDVDERTSLFKRLAREKYAQRFDLLDQRSLVNWLRLEVKGRGGSINTDALEALAGAVGNDLWNASTEIDKLIAYKDKKVIERADVESLVKGKFDDNIFNFIDSIANKNKKLAHQLLSDQLNSGANELYLLTMLIRQFRILLLVKDLSESGGYLAKQQVASELGIHPYVAQKALAQVRNFTSTKLANIYKLLLSTDAKIKTSYADSKVLFDLLLTKIMN